MMMTVKQESPNSTLNTSEFSSDENLKTNNSEPPKKVSKSSTGKENTIKIKKRMLDMQRDASNVMNRDLYVATVPN